jgi:CRP-like cAMP-binding protein
VPEIRNNRLLAALPGVEWRLWGPLLESVHLDVGTVLHEPGRVPPYAYFPTTAVVSLLYLSESGDCDEVAVVGREGVVGLSLFMGGESTPASAVVQSAGQAYRAPAWKIAGEFERSSQLMHLLLRFSLALGAQIAQTSVCNRHHTVSQRLCRRLLQGLDRQPGREIVTTQEQLAGLLGVRRESVTMEAQKLQKAGCVHYSRGHIMVLDRVALERHACGCQATMEMEYRRLLPVGERDAAVEMAPSTARRCSNGMTAYRHPPERPRERVEAVC